MDTCSTSDESTCCEKDATKCRGNTNSSASCDATSFADTAKGDTAIASDFQANCCTAKATGLTCTTSATNSADTCTSCCEADTTICDAWGVGAPAGVSVTCPTGKFRDPSKAGVAPQRDT